MHVYRNCDRMNLCVDNSHKASCFIHNIIVGSRYYIGMARMPALCNKLRFQSKKRGKFCLFM